MQSLRNKITHTPRNEQPNDYIQPMGEQNQAYEEDYPHPKHGSLKNELLSARMKMNRKQTPQEWRNERPNMPPKDYPSFPGNKSSQQFPRKPFTPHNTNDNYGQRPSSGLSRQESETMAVYDQTIASGYGNAHQNYPANRNSSYLHRN